MQKLDQKLENYLKKMVLSNFLKNLIKIDPKAEGRILATDSQRTQRAYEVKIKTKKSIFDWYAKTQSDFLDFDLKKVLLISQRKSF